MLNAMRRICVVRQNIEEREEHYDIREMFNHYMNRIITVKSHYGVEINEFNLFDDSQIINEMEWFDAASSSVRDVLFNVFSIKNIGLLFEKPESWLYLFEVKDKSGKRLGYITFVSGAGNILDLLIEELEALFQQVMRQFVLDLADGKFKIEAVGADVGQ